jgi:hypothetical protein
MALSISVSVIAACIAAVLIIFVIVTLLFRLFSSLTVLIKIWRIRQMLRSTMEENLELIEL